MSKYLTQSSTKNNDIKPIDSDFFDISSFRTRLQEKHTGIAASSQYTSPSSLNQVKSAKAASQSNAAIPSFDSLQYKLKNFSFTKVNQERPKSSLIKSPSKDDSQNYSPLKFSGMQKKQSIRLKNIFNRIQTISNQPVDINRINMYISQSPLMEQKKRFQENAIPSNSNFLTTFKSSFFNDYSTEKSSHRKQQNSVNQYQSAISSNYKQQASVTSFMSLQEIVNLRNKIESVNVHGPLQPTYTSELVKLAQVITTKLKCQK